MPKTKISEFSATPANNTDIDSINIAEGCAPSGINDAIRELMAQLKDFQTGAVGDSFNGPVGSTTAGTGAFTTLSASGTATLSGLTASTALALDASKNIVSVTNTGTGSNVLATSPTLVTPALGTPSSGVVTNLTGTASININGTVGATTATTGAFTTLAASSTVTLSGGTANGVAYLNGSKVVTSGSALTFDGTSLGVGTASPAEKVGINQGNIYALRTGGAKLRLADQNNECSVESSPTSGDSQLVFKSNATEGMRLTSTGLGIGTSSPAYKLDVQTSAGRFQVQNYGAGSVLLYSNGALAYNAATTGHQWQLNGTEQMRLDSSGNLGLGVTPSAWDTAVFRTLQVGTGVGSASLSGRTDGIPNATLGINVYYGTGAYRYIGNGTANYYNQQSGVHSWHTAASGTAGNAITFTQAMTLDASGNLLVGATSAAGAERLNIVGGTGIRVNEDGIGTKILTIRSDYAGLGPAINVTTTHPLLFLTGNTERARIDSSGNLLVGTTSTSNGALINWYKASGTIETSLGGITTAQNHIVFANPNGNVGSIQVDGSATSYNTSSDYRLKNITGALTGYKERLMSLQPKQGTWVVDGSEFRGFVAHEFAQPYRASVTGEKDAVDETGNPIYQGMQASSSEVMADLVALVQEQQAIIESMRTEIDALKVKVGA